jgi:hypothetical protein
MANVIKTEKASLPMKRLGNRYTLLGMLIFMLTPSLCFSQNFAT